MSQTESLAAPKASFDRRSVVKTAAWSVPVIAAAIAAPAAAASTPTQTLSAALILGTVPPAISGTPQMSGTGYQGFAVTTTAAAVTGAISVVIDVQPDAATAATGVGLAVTAAAQPPSGQSSPYKFAYSRTGTGNVASNVVLKYTVTVNVTVVESATKKTALPAMVFVATLQPISTVAAGAEVNPLVIGGSPETVGRGPQRLTITTTGTAVTGTPAVTFTVTPSAAAAAAGIGLNVTATALTRTGQTAPYELVYTRTTGGAVANGTELKYSVAVSVSGVGAAPATTTFDIYLRKKGQ